MTDWKTTTLGKTGWKVGCAVLLGSTNGEIYGGNVLGAITDGSTKQIPEI
jgi:hypothetical protein